jgi:predicted transcriptional regulator
MTVMSQQHFYGRKKKLELLKRRVLDLKEGYRQNMAFLGDRYTGKTMIVRRFLSELDDPQIVPVYIDFENSDLAYFFYKMAGSLLYHGARVRGLSVTDDLTLLMNSTESHLPETTKAIKKIQSHLAHNREKEAYLEIIDLPQIYTQETNVYCVLFFDEFQHLEDFGIEDEFQSLGKGIMTQRRCLYVVTSSQLWTAQKILSEKLTLLFGNFEVIEIKPFDMKTSGEFVLYQLPGIRLSEQLMHFLIDFTAGHPLYLTLICEELRALCASHRQSEIFLPMLTRAIEDMLRKRWGVLSRHFDLILDQIASGKGNVVVSRILLSLAGGRQKIGELSASLNLKQASVSGRVTRLVELGVVAKNGNYFYIADRLFKYWLKFVYNKRRRVIVDQDDRLSEEFRREFNNSFETSCANGRKDVSSQILELLSCFENEALSMNGRRYKLPLFRQMTPTRIRMSAGGHLDLIRALSDEGEWLIVLKSGTVGENEISNLLAETKKIANKPQKFVLISLDGLDENARIRALQERMWIWNEGELNTLASIFDKSFIARFQEAKN